MKTNKNKKNIWIDAFLFAGFVISFFLDLTGVILHQWLGLALALLAAYHLIVHWDWVEAVTMRFFGRTSDQARMYYLIDFGLLVGFYLIFLSGLMISTWIKLPISNYLLFRNLHIAISVSMLLVVIKIAVHWRWIVKALRRKISPVSSYKSPRGASQPVLVRVNSGRRDFLKLMGVVGAASFLAAISALDNKGEAYANETVVDGEGENLTNKLVNESSDNILLKERAEQTIENPQTTLPASEVQSDILVQDPNPEIFKSEPTSTQQSAPTQPVLQEVPTTLDSPELDAPASPCTVRCHKGCAYPGGCRRYTDSNGNGLCDLGECI